MDPVFGRGYCEEVDWCQRAGAVGYRSVLGFGSFAFHHGGASNRPAGLLREASTTVLDHERIVEMRYPGYHDGLAAFDDHPELETARMRAIAVAAEALLRRDGYDLVLAALDLADRPGARARRARPLPSSRQRPQQGCGALAAPPSRRPPS